MRRFSTALSITDPLVKYQTLVSSGVYSPDPAQHRLTRHLHKIYLRIKDYSPQVDYRQRLQQVATLTSQQPPPEVDGDGGGRGVLALRHHSIWRNPLFKHLLPNREGRDSVALTRTFKSHETAIEVDSPKGLFLSGEVGTGKSMLLDLLADGLPTEKKRRWHFNTCMLYAFSQLEKHRQSLPLSLSEQSDYSLLWMAKKMVDESPILFLDEFQLPDRAASKLLSHLFIAFFQLGGVLIASSNRMPEELQKASGIDYAPSPTNGLMRKLFGGASSARGELFGSTSDFANFLEVLKARCDFWQMEATRDWRRKEEGTVSKISSSKALSADRLSPDISHAIGADVNIDLNPDPDTTSTNIPRNYFLLEDDEAAWEDKVNAFSPPQVWEPSVLTVYGRQVRTPKHYHGSVSWDFDEIVGTFGPADYLTMASSYHTFIIDKVPILTLSRKNEARRFITLLDCLYEARCKLLIRAANPPDDLFFPPMSQKRSKSNGDPSNDDGDATYSETISEVYQDQISPFRPNVSYYDTPSSTSQYDPDQDSDFGHQKQAVNLSNASAFTGEDERFAYKRAISRLWELCSEQWHSRTGDWWQPLPKEARHWEEGPPSQPMNARIQTPRRDPNEFMGPSIEIEEVAGLAKWRIEYLKRGGDQGKR